jgi:hypothetical protein
MREAFLAAGAAFQKRAQTTAPFAKIAKPCMLAESFKIRRITILMLFSLYGIAQVASKKAAQAAVRFRPSCHE